MKTTLVILTMLALPLFCEEDWQQWQRRRDEAVKALYDAWYAKYGEESIRKFTPVFDDRNDPPYLSWKQARCKMALFDGFTHAANWYKEKMPVEWSQFEQAGGDYATLNDWAWKNIRPPGHTSHYDYPPPAGWTATKVNDQGVAVDKDGKVSNLAYGPNWTKYFWFPTVLGIVVGLFAASKGFGEKGVGLAFVGTLVAYGYLTDPWSVFECFFSVYIVLVLAVVAIFKMILSGLGFKK